MNASGEVTANPRPLLASREALEKPGVLWLGSVAVVGRRGV
jgi:hypothetical protein